MSTRRHHRLPGPLLRRIAIFGVLVSCWLSVSAAELHGQVVGVTDGDTVTVLDHQRTQHKIRLAGIDAPEKSQPFGQRAKEHLSSLVFGRSVVGDAEKQDRYRRTVGKVLINGRDANLAMVAAGFAWHYKKYEGEQSSSDRLLYSAAESEAQATRRGLWSELDPVPPWDWRRKPR